MAIAIPILLMATEAGAAMAAALSISTGMLAAGAGLVMAATGVGDKINKAASNVFGKDLVNFANIAGGIGLAAGWNPAGTLSSMTGAAANASASVGGALPAAANAAPGAFDPAGPAMTADTGNAAAFTASPGNNPSAYTPPSGMAPAAAPSMPPSPGNNPSAYTSPGGGAPPPAGGDGIDLMRKSEIAYANSPAAAAVKTYQPPAPTDRLGALKAWYGIQSEPVKAALITSGMQAISGVAQGYSRNQELTRAEAERRRREDRFNTGSGTAFTYTAPSAAQIGK